MKESSAPRGTGRQILEPIESLLCLKGWTASSAMTDMTSKSSIFTLDQCLEFEGMKSEKLQFFLINSLKRIDELEVQLKKSRSETADARNELATLRSEMIESRRMPEARDSPSSSCANADDDASVYATDDDCEMPPRQQIFEYRRQPVLPPPGPVSCQMMPYSARVEKAIDSVATSLINPDANTPPRDFLFKFVCRIFDGGDLYYGYIVAFNRMLFQVVYNDGDTQRLSLKEVRLSLVEEILVPTQIAFDCRMHFQSADYLTRKPLPTIS